VKTVIINVISYIIHYTGRSGLVASNPNVGSWRVCHKKLLWSTAMTMSGICLL